MRSSVPRRVVRLLPLLMLPAILSACSAGGPGGAGNAPAPHYASRCPAVVDVTAGETVYSLARRCGVSVREIIETNNLQPPYALSSGMRLRVPGGGDYEVRRGDTLSKVARQFHVDFQSLASVNGLRPPYVIKVGDHLRIPGSFSEPGNPTGPGGLVIASPNSGLGGAPSPSSPSSSSYQPTSARPLDRLPPRSEPAAAAPSPVPLQPALPSASPAEATPAVATAAPPPAGVPPEPGPTSGHGFLWPVKGEVVLGFGPQPAKGQNNDGINIAAPKGAPVRAAENGVVAYVGNELKGFGNLILIKHADGWMTAYAHADHISVRRGDKVRRGQQIATVGATGNVETPQLHFEIRHGTEAVDPAQHLEDGPVG